MQGLAGIADKCLWGSLSLDQLESHVSAAGLSAPAPPRNRRAATLFELDTSYQIEVPNLKPTA